MTLVEQLSTLQKDKEKCESDRFANVDQFMAGQLHKDVYQRRRTELRNLAEKLDNEIAVLEKKIADAERAEDVGVTQLLDTLKKYSGAKELTKEIVQALIDRVVVTDPEHVEIVWKFGDEIKKFIED